MMAGRPQPIGIDASESSSGLSRSCAIATNSSSGLPLVHTFPVVIRCFAGDGANLIFRKVTQWRGCAYTLDNLRQPRDHREFRRRYRSVNDNSAASDNQEWLIGISILPVAYQIMTKNRLKDVRRPRAGKDRLARIQETPRKNRLRN